MIPVTDRIRQSLVSLHMARALETLDQILSRMEKGEMSAIEAIDALLAEELTCQRRRKTLPLGRSKNRPVEVWVQAA